MTVVPSITGSDNIGAGVGIFWFIASVSSWALIFNAVCKFVFVVDAVFIELTNDVVLIAFIADAFKVFCATTGVRLWFNCVITAFAASTAAWTVDVFGSTYGVNVEPWLICPAKPEPVFVSSIGIIVPFVVSL